MRQDYNAKRRERYRTDPEYRARVLKKNREKYKDDLVFRRRILDAKGVRYLTRRELVVEYNLKHKFGMTLDAYNELLELQGGTCAICHQGCPSGKRLAVDHDHETGKIRGLLCLKCNVGLGSFRDSYTLLEAAQWYLSHAEGASYD